MSGVLSNQFSFDGSLIEATVIDVDPIRYNCVVRTSQGQILQEVCWISPFGGTGATGMHFTPSIDDRVIINTSLSYPIILGCLPTVGTPTSSSNSPTSSGLSVDAGHDSSLKNGFTNNPNKPDDFTPGDVVFSTDGGGLLGVLNSGGVIAKASPLAKIVLSKFGDLVRIVARNYERFSDVGQHTAANVSNRLYEFFGWDRNLENSKVGTYELTDIIGDVAAGEVLKGEPNTSASLPGKDSRIRQYSLGSGGSAIMQEVLTDDGTITTTVTRGGTTVTTHAGSKWEANSTSGGYSKVTVIPSSITIDFNGSSTIVTDASGVKIDHGGHFVHVDDSGVHFG